MYCRGNANHVQQQYRTDGLRSSAAVSAGESCRRKSVLNQYSTRGALDLALTISETALMRFQKSMTCS